METDVASVKVALGDRSYEVHIERGALSRVASFVPEGHGVTRALVVSDTHVAPLYSEKAMVSFRAAGIPTALAVIPAGEKEKNLHRVEAIYHEMVKAGLDRKSLVVALGGGVVGDVAGFAAATYMRGIAVMQAATTLVAAVDSSIGGKTGVDLPEGKNLVGAFHQPVAVVVDPDALSTLPERELRAGLAEVIKHGVIRDEAYFAELEREGARLVRMESALAERVIRRSVEIKAAVVSADERESGLRAILNFGHTVGHAVETLTGYSQYLHGEAVAIGMCAASYLAEGIGVCREEVRERIVRVIAAVGLPTTPEGVRAADVISSFARDKKSVGGKAQFVLPRRIGEVDIFDDVPESAVELALRKSGFE